jgi:hypothetical protein
MRSASSELRLHAATFADALAYWQLSAAWWGGATPVRLGAWGDGEVMWRRGARADLADTVRWLDERHDDDVLLGLPHDRPWAGGVSRASMLWARVEGADQLARARRFRPSAVDRVRGGLVVAAAAVLAARGRCMGGWM